MLLMELQSRILQVTDFFTVSQFVVAEIAKDGFYEAQFLMTFSRCVPFSHHTFLYSHGRHNESVFNCKHVN